MLRRSPLEVKVRNATSNDPWGVKTSEKSEIAEASFNLFVSPFFAIFFTFISSFVCAFFQNLREERKVIMKVIWERLGEAQKNWRNVQKALQLLEYLVIHGSSTVYDEAKDNVYTIRTLRNFNFVDEQGRELGKGGSFFLFDKSVIFCWKILILFFRKNKKKTVRDLAKNLAKLLHQPDEIKKLRQEGKKETSKYAGISREDAENKKSYSSGDQNEEKEDKGDNDEDEYFAKGEDSKNNSNPESKSKDDNDDDDDYDDYDSKAKEEKAQPQQPQKPKESIIIVKRPRAPSIKDQQSTNFVQTNNTNFTTSNQAPMQQPMQQQMPQPQQQQKATSLLDINDLFESVPAKPQPQQFLPQQNMMQRPVPQQQIPQQGFYQPQQQMAQQGFYQPQQPMQQQNFFQQQQMPQQAFYGQQQQMPQQQQNFFQQQQRQQQQAFYAQQQQQIPQQQKKPLDFMDDFTDFKAGSQQANNNNMNQQNGAKSNEFFDFTHGLVNFDFGGKK